MVTTQLSPATRLSSFRITFQQDHLSRGLAIVSRAVGGRTTLPVLNNVLLASDGDRLRLSATNLEIGITTWVPGSVSTQGHLTVPARLLADFVNSLPGRQTVELEGDTRSHALHVKSGRYTANVKGIDAAEFPPIPTAADRPTIKLNAGLLKEMIGQVAFSAARDESRPVLAGVHVRLEGSTLTLTTADGFRLSIRRATLDRAASHALDVIVPARALVELGRLLADPESEVEIAVTPGRSQILFRILGGAASADVSVVSRLLEGQFPDVARVIPRSHTTRALLRREELSTAVSIASLFARAAANLVTLELSGRT